METVHGRGLAREPSSYWSYWPCELVHLLAIFKRSTTFKSNLCICTKRAPAFSHSHANTTYLSTCLLTPRINAIHLLACALLQELIDRS